MAALTLGVEEELHLIDLSTFRLAGRAPALLAKLPGDHFSSELQRTTVETNTAVVDSLADLRADILRLRRELVSVAGAEGIGIAAVGTAPMTGAADFELTSTGRFARMQEDYRLLVDEQLICGTQFHAGVPDRDLAVRVIQRITPDIPTLLAISGSSPLWHGSDTGYASIRSMIWQRWPTAGLAGPMSSGAEYDELLSDLIRSGVITDSKMAYFDLRPSAHVPTIELRICDACPLVDDALLIAGIFRAMVQAAVEAEERGDEFVPRAQPVHRAAVWRAARSGVTGQLLDANRRPEPRPAPDVVRDLHERHRPQLADTGDWDETSTLLEMLLSRGASADRQRTAFSERGRLADVVLQVVAETQDEHPQMGSLPTETSYPRSNADEAYTPSSAVRPLYAPLIDAVREIGPTLPDRMDERDRWLTGAGMTFGVEDEQLPFQVDLIPRLIPAHEWQGLRDGLIQRARVLEMFLQDVYGPGEVVRDGVVPPEVITELPGWREEARQLPRGTVRAAVLGFDLVRDDNTGWKVLEDNARVPSGAGYAMAARQLMDAVMPDLPRPDGLLASHTAPGVLRRTMQTLSDVDNPVIALLSDGAGNAAWFEHRLLAERAGFLLAQPHEIDVRGPFVTVLGRRVDVLYLRLDVELGDLVDEAGRPVGAQIMHAAVRGSVKLANSPGNGVADDKSMYCYVPELIAYYLGERALLDAVPTYRCVIPDERRAVLARLDQLVTKPVDGYGGGGVLIGPHADDEAIEARRLEIEKEPERWIAQETVNLSTHPTIDGDGLLPRHVDLRAFVYLTGTGERQAQVADLALTRVAPSGSMLVNSSRGGGAKDTWILSDADVVRMAAGDVGPEDPAAIDLSKETR